MNGSEGVSNRMSNTAASKGTQMMLAPRNNYLKMTSGGQWFGNYIRARLQTANLNKNQ